MYCAYKLLRSIFELTLNFFLASGASKGPNCSSCTCKSFSHQNKNPSVSTSGRHCESKIYKESNKIKSDLKQARYSKSLDQLQFSRKNNFYSSLYNIADYTENLRSLLCMKDHNGKKHNQRSFDEDKLFKSTNYDIIRKDNLSDLCDCYKYKVDYKDETLNESTTYSSIGLKGVDFNNSNSIDDKYKQFAVKNFTNIKQKCQKLVKSLSHTPSESTQHIFRSSSMQITSPNINPQMNGFAFSEEMEKCNHFSPKMCRGEQPAKVKTTDISLSLIDVNDITEENCSDISVEHSSALKKESQFSNNSVIFNIISLRKVRSAACLGGYVSSVVLSGTESLPNISAFVEENVHCIDMTSYSSSSSCTSERSGWISSRSSSETSTETNKTTLNNGILQSLIDFEKKLQNFPFNKFENNRSKKHQKINGYFPDSKGK